MRCWTLGFEDFNGCRTTERYICTHEKCAQQSIACNRDTCSCENTAWILVLGRKNKRRTAHPIDVKPTGLRNTRSAQSLPLHQKDFVLSRKRASGKRSAWRWTALQRRLSFRLTFWQAMSCVAIRSSNPEPRSANLFVSQKGAGVHSRPCV